MKKKKVCILACDAFWDEMEAVRKSLSLESIFGCDFEVKYLTQKLHIDFTQLQKELSRQLEKISADIIILLYGAKCHPNFSGFIPGHTCHLEEKNCMHAISGMDTELYTRTFFLNPLQVKNWRSFFLYDQKNDEQKQQFKEKFCQYCDDALFADTGTQKVTKQELGCFQQSTGLTVTTAKIGLEPFQKCLLRTIKKALAAKA